MKKYKILYDWDIDSLDKKINDLVKKNWILVGPVQIAASGQGNASRFVASLEKLKSTIL